MIEKDIHAEETVVNPNMKASFTENIFQSQKTLIREATNRLKSTKTLNTLRIDPSEANKYLIFNDNNEESEAINWQSAEFDCEEFYNEDYPFIKSKWENANLPYNPEGVDINKRIFKSNEEIQRTDIFVDVTLKGSSEFWLFTRSSDVLDKNTAVIKISKDEGCQRVYISFGTFIEDGENLLFKIFLKRQIISFSKISKKELVEKDISQVKGTIMDNGSGKIKANFYLNGSKTENTVNADFFLPTVNRFKLLIGGTGEGVFVKTFYGKSMAFDLPEETLTLSTERRNCECCKII